MLARAVGRSQIEKTVLRFLGLHTFFLSLAPEPPLDSRSWRWASHAFPVVKGSRLKRVQNKVGTF